MDKEFEHPRHYRVMAYTVFPNLSRDAFTVHDTAQGDVSRRIGQASGGRASAASIGVMARSTPEKPLRFGGSEQGAVYTTASAMHFEPVDRVEWFLLFCDMPVPKDITAVLL